jgi:hypothetical protein
LTVCVPPADTRLNLSALIDSEVDRKLTEADVVLGIVGINLNPACLNELNRGMGLNKNMIVMSDPVSAPQLQPYFNPKLVVFDPLNPDQAEAGIVEHLKLIEGQQSAKKALLALGTLALGLFLLAPADRN